MGQQLATGNDVRQAAAQLCRQTSQTCCGKADSLQQQLAMACWQLFSLLGSSCC
jgi:hypothetical protein